MFGEYHLDFVRPWYLALLAVLPALWWFSFRTLAGLGPVRRLMALALRSLVFALLVLALAEVQLVRSSEALTVTFLLDQSLSVPTDLRLTAMKDYYNQVVARYLGENLKDRAGAIVFGRTAEVDMDALFSSLAMDVILRVLFSRSAAADAHAAAQATQVLSRVALQEMFRPFTLPAWLPWRECASASTRQVVRRSGTFTGTFARPCSSVTISGSKRNVSGNHARVAAGAPPSAFSPSDSNCSFMSFAGAAFFGIAPP